MKFMGLGQDIVESKYRFSSISAVLAGTVYLLQDSVSSNMKWEKEILSM